MSVVSIRLNDYEDTLIDTAFEALTPSEANRMTRTEFIRSLILKGAEQIHEEAAMLEAMAEEN